MKEKRKKGWLGLSQTLSWEKEGKRKLYMVEGFKRDEREEKERMVRFKSDT